MKYLRFFAITLFIILLASCQNIFGGGDSSSSSYQNKHYISFSGSISLEGAYPATIAANASRTAFPTIPTGAVYRVTAAKNDTITYDSTSGNGDITLAADNSSFTIRQLETGVEWIITVSIHDSADTSFAYPLMSDSFPKTFSLEDSVLTHAFTLKPTLTEGTGKVTLSLTAPANSITRFTAICLSSNSSNWSEVEINTTGSVTLTKNNIAAGSYLVQLNFEKDYCPVYSDIQIINVFKNMNTNVWVNNGGSGPIQSDGTYQVTQAMIDSYAQTQIYVGKNKYSTSFGTGSKFSPYARLSDAFRYIAATGNSTTNYTIWVSGGWTSDEVKGGYIREITKIDDIYILDGKSKSITIQGLNGLDSNGDPLDYLEGFADKLNNNYDFKNFDYDFIHSTFNDGEEFAPVLTIDYPDTSTNTLDIRLKNIGIRKGVANEGAGLKLIGTKLKLTINDGVKISGNYSGNSAGGLYIEKATVIMNGGKISSNKTYNSNTNADSSGGAIRLANSGKFTLNDGEISYNLAHKYGGAISLITSGSSASGNSFTMNGGKICNNSTASIYGYGGAVYLVNGTFTMTAGEISSNSTSNEAGAVYINGPLDSSAIFDMQGGLIKDNTFNGAPDTSKTSAIYLNKGAFKMKGNSFIPKSNAKHIVYLASDKTIEITGSLTPKSTGTASGTPENVAAVINLAATYTANLEVLTGSNSSNVNSASGKMRMTTQNWFIKAGKLAQGILVKAEDLEATLSELSTNTTDTPYNIIIEDSTPDLANLRTIIENGGKYICLSFPNATFTTLDGAVGSSKIVKLTIPASVTTVTQNSASSGFSYSSFRGLKEIEVEADNTSFKAIDGVLYTYGGTKLIAYPIKKTDSTYSFPDDVEEIGSHAFYYNPYLTSITIPGHIKTIGDAAFYYNSNLSSVTLQNGIESIDNHAFQSIDITTITIPATVTYLGTSVFPFIDCNKLTEILVADGSENYYTYDGAIYDKNWNLLCCPNGKAGTFKVKSTLNGLQRLPFGVYDNQKITKIIFEEGITIIPQEFTSCKAATSMAIPLSVTTIVKFPSNVTTVYYKGTSAQRASNITITNSPSQSITWNYSSYPGD